MQMLKKKRLFISIGLASGLIFGLFIFISIDSAKKLKNQLLNEFSVFKDSSSAKIFKKQYKDNNVFGFATIKHTNNRGLGLCYSFYNLKNHLSLYSLLFKIANKRINEDENIQCKNPNEFIESIKKFNLVMPPYIFSLSKLKEFKFKYYPDIFVRFGLFITNNSSEINFIQKLETLSKELKNDFVNFGILNAAFSDNRLNITLTRFKKNSGIRKDFETFKSVEISLNHNDPRAFFVFILHKANIFDKKNIYGSLLKNLYPDFMLKRVIENKLISYINTANTLKDFSPSYIHMIEEFKEKTNQIIKSLKNIESPDWIQNEIEKLVFWCLETYVYISIEQKEVIFNYLDNPETLFRMVKTLIQTPEEFTNILEILKQFQETNKITIKNALESLKEFLIEFYQDYSDKKFGINEESNLRGSVKFLRNEIVKKLYENSIFLDLFTSFITIAMKHFGSYSDAYIMVYCQILREIFLFYFRLYEVLFTD